MSSAFLAECTLTTEYEPIVIALMYYIYVHSAYFGARSLVWFHTIDALYAILPFHPTEIPDRPPIKRKSMRGAAGASGMMAPRPGLEPGTY